MNEDTQTLNKPNYTLAMHPKKFALWLFMISAAMLFAALTSAYIVRSGEGSWVEFEMPVEFWYTSGVIFLSSVSMQMAYFSAKKDKLNLLKATLLITLLFGLVFLAGQWLAWRRLVQEEVFFVGNPSGSFIYVFSGVHALHIISAIIFLLFTTGAAFRYRVHSKKLLKIEMATTYWHFLGGLWLYLFFFIMLNKY